MRNRGPVDDNHIKGFCYKYTLRLAIESPPLSTYASYTSQFVLCEVVESVKTWLYIIIMLVAIIDVYLQSIQAFILFFFLIFFEL